MNKIALLKTKTIPSFDGLIINYKEETTMNAEHEKSRRQAENRITEVNNYLDSGKVKDARHHEMLESMREKAYNTLKHIKEMERMENARPYSGTSIGYNADAGGCNDARGNANNDANDAMRNAMDAINKILPHLTGDAYESAAEAYNNAMAAYNEAEMKRGVPGSGRGRRRIRVGGYTRRAEMDNMDYNDDMDARTTSDNERMNEAVARAAATAAADTARHMTNDARGKHDGIYPGTPVMPHNAYNDGRGDARGDNTMSDRSRQIGPGARE